MDLGGKKRRPRFAAHFPKEQGVNDVRWFITCSLWLFGIPVHETKPRVKDFRCFVKLCCYSLRQVSSSEVAVALRRRKTSDSAAAPYAFLNKAGKCRL